MTSGRDENRALILSRIRTALGIKAFEPLRDVLVMDRLGRHPRNTVPARAKQDSQSLLRLFGEMLTAQGADVAQAVTPEAVVGTIADYLAKHGLAAAIRMSEEPVLATLPWTLVPQIKVSRGAVDASDQVGFSRAIAGVAETGTLFLVSGAGNPTALNFLPKTHIVLVSAADIVGAYEDGWDRLRKLYGPGTLPRSVNWISGPSRTADIEQTIVRGAHGPKRLLVVVQS